MGSYSGASVKSYQGGKGDYGGSMGGGSSSGPCSLLFNEPFNNSTSWGVTGSSSIVAGRTGTALSLNGFGVTADRTIADSDYLTVGFAYNTAALQANEIIWGVRNTNVPEDVFQFRTQVNGSIEAQWDNGSIRGTSAAGVLTASTWYYLEFQIRIHHTLGAVTVKVNGTTVLSLSGIDTMVTAPIVNQMRLWNWQSTGATLFDDMYVSSGSGCAFRGDQHF